MDYIVKSNDLRILIEQEKKRISKDIIMQLCMLRKKMGLTQQQVADLTGIKRANIARIEGQKYTPTLDVLVKLADSMGMSLEIQLVKKQVQ